MDHTTYAHPSHPHNSSGISRPRSSSIYGMQVHAFLDAADVVDADPEIIEDILDGFPADALPQDVIERDASNLDIDVGNTYIAGQMEEYADDFDAFLSEARSTWTQQEVKQMMTHLKERGMSPFINEYVVGRAIPIPRLLYAFGICLCKELRMKRHRTLMYFLKVALSRELQSREKLPMYNTIDDAINLIRSSKRILILTGAGISVSCGIPDFRSRNGLYATLQETGEYDLDDPQQMFDIHYFRENPSVFYSFASKIYPSNFIPSPCHRFIKLIEDKGKLLRNYTQNIDTLEKVAGVQRVIQCHGSFATASCVNCKKQVRGSEIADDIMNHRVPLCKFCNPQISNSSKRKSKKRKSGWDSDQSDEPDRPNYPPGIMKPDITFFGEKLDDVFDRSLLTDRQVVDLLIVIGTSLKVSPVSETLAYLPHSVPQILINKTPIKHINPDIVMLGDADTIVQHLCQKLGWELPVSAHDRSDLNALHSNVKKRPSAEFESQEPQRVGNSHVWLFEGAEGGKWVEEMEKSQQTLDSPLSESPPGSSSSSENGVRHSKKARVQ